MSYIDLSTGINVPAQFPLNPKGYFKTLAEMRDLGVHNYKAYGYYKGMPVQCAENDTTYIWRESLENEQGVLDEPFVYPNGVVANGIDYSGLAFNFFLTRETTIINALKEEDKIISGKLFWEDGLTFSTSNFKYIINGIIYSPANQTIILEESDPTYPRKDVFVADSVTGQIIVLTGEPATNPVEKTPEFGLQLRVASIDILPGDTKPNNVSNEIIYNEKVEWVIGESPSGSDLEDETTFYKGNKSISLPPLVNTGNVLKFTNQFHLVYSKDNIFFFAIKLSAPLSSNSNIVFYIEDTLVETNFSFTANRDWLINNAELNNNITTWQMLRINMRLFNFNRTEYDIVSFKFVNTPAIHLDFIGVQSGIVVPQEVVYVPTKLSEFQNDVPYVTFQDLIPSNTGNAIIEGGVQWLGEGLNYRIWASKYIINNIVRTQFVQGNVELEEGGNKPRIDVFYIQNNGINSPVVGVRQGAEDDSPVKPDLLDPINQVEVSFKLVLPEEVAPPETFNNVIFNEDGAGEWENTEIPTGASLTTTGLGYMGTKFFRISGTSGEPLTFVNDGTPVPYKASNTINFALRVNTYTPNGYIMHIMLKTASRPNPPSHESLNLNETKLLTYGFTKANVGGWQMVSIPLEDFPFIADTAEDIEAISFKFWNMNAVDIDYIHGQGDVETPSNPTPITGNQDNGLYKIGQYMVDRRGGSNKINILAGNIIYGIGNFLPNEYIIAMAKVDNPSSISDLEIFHRYIITL